MARRLERQAPHRMTRVNAGKGLIGDYPLVLFYDACDRLIPEFIAFMVHAAKPAHNVTNVHTYRRMAAAMQSFGDHLAENRLRWQRFDDEDFERYRQDETRRVLARQNEGDDQAAAINVNFKIDVIYDFYEFAQMEDYVTDHIGPHCPIDTELSEVPADRRVHPYRTMRIERIGERRVIVHFATDQQIEALLDWFIRPARHGHVYKAERDVLLVATHRHTAFRGDSVASLTIDQFPTLEELRAMSFSETVPLRPARQKRNYRMTLEVSRAYALLVRAFIDGPRQDLLKSLGISEAAQAREIFLSSTTGRAMGADSLGDIISDGFRAIGVTTRRTGGHAIRRYRGDQWAADIIRRKREIGGVITPEAVEAELARLMFHGRKQSNEPYVRQRKRLDAETDAAYQQRLRDENALKAEELAAREARLLAWEQRLTALERSPGTGWIGGLAGETTDWDDDLGDCGSGP